MTQRGSFFDSTAGDRIYDAATLARALNAMISDGVLDGTGSELAVTEQSPPAMGVRVGLGIAFVRGYYFEVYSTAESLALAAANPTNPRIDRIVVRRDLTNRQLVLAVLQGTAAASPTAPALTQVSGGTWELPLAQVLVPAGAASIVNANITDERTYALATLGAQFDPATGHDHDGSDSKAVAWGSVASKPTTFAPTAHAIAHNPGGTDPVTTGAPGASAPDDTQSGGAAASLSRSDHRHARENFGSVGTSAVGDAQNAGVSGLIPRADHRHGREAFATPAIALGSAAAAGVATTPIRSDATIAAFDATAPETQAMGDAAAVGVAARAARRDHKHGMPAFGNVVAQTTDGAASGNGAAATPARSDHAHGTPPAQTLASIGGAAAYDTPATADGGKRVYVGTSTPTGASEGDIWVKG